MDSAPNKKGPNGPYDLCKKLVSESADVWVAMTLKFFDFIHMPVGHAHRIVRGRTMGVSVWDAHFVRAHVF